MKAKLKLPLLSEDSADEKGRELLGNARQRQGRIPNMYAEMAHAPGLLSTYLHGYDWFRKESGFTPAEQEVILLTISRENACHYCVAAHSMIAEKMSKVPPQALQAIREGGMIEDAKLRTLAEFVQQMVQTRGNPSQASLEAFTGAGYSEQQALQVVLALAVKTISNYTNHLFDTLVDDAFAAYALTK
ncbi:hypothetical protein GCM10010975_02400 [Comamonas phosphati]|nr:hypothetical protein GCM10010975_02400 [Comamonas phosphati]